ncbi:type I restriction-modification system subunit M [Dehalococcoides mccartyi]|uniref:site-specific DNA-methyltransferase (adenine-specific) n=1 Tax=Dehalococcoides mccartyi (strain CBDB1) TaxID=255470 RepID=A0A916KLH0_DEHMC|nr:class I SAM-dependent DNA methyltransferase [Dehalococcoides mccartyi]CAI82368.1 putative type I restriction-modification system methylation subunit [Dehalococcoides mccartyi CBDB1]
MARNITVRPFRRLTQAELDAFLEKAANILRGNVDHSEFRGYVFALLFFKRISDVYIEEVRKLTAQLGDETLAKDPKMHNFVVPDGSLWDIAARQSRNQVGTTLNEAMIAIERANQPKFDGILTSGVDFNDAEKLPRDKLINLINHFSSQIFDRAHVTDDVLGNAYEYLIRNFASRAGKSSGEFYTPKEVAYLMSEIVEPQPGQSICDWASGSGGLLLQCRNYVTRQCKDPDRLLLYAQESNLSTYNISRINMILHGVKSWEHRHQDSLRNPLHVDDGKKLLKFDRIVMNPPFSLEDWGYDDFQGGDPFGRFGYGMPPRNNGDYAWLEHVLKSLKDTGKAIVVMSQGVLFRGQPEQTEEDDGRNQSADAEYVIREGFIKADAIECVIVLPSKLFYGNTVPGCLIIMNKNKPPERKNKILMIWASRNFQNANPQNILRPSDLMRILVPWRAFGDLDLARRLVSIHEEKLVQEEELERQRRLKDIEDAYAPILEPLETLTLELSRLETSNWQSNGYSRKSEQVIRIRELKRSVKELGKIQGERNAAEDEVNSHANQEIAHIHEAATDLLSICSDPNLANRYFSVVDINELSPNEYNLNMSRYVDTYDEREEYIPLPDAANLLQESERRRSEAMRRVSLALGACNYDEV